jgi:hypothetical protein
MSGPTAKMRFDAESRHLDAQRSLARCKNAEGLSCCTRT